MSNPTYPKFAESSANSSAPKILSLEYASTSTPLLTDEEGNPILCYFYWLKSFRMGPVTLEELRNLRLFPKTWVLAYGTSVPKSACQFPELSDLYPNPPSASSLLEPDPEFPRPSPREIHINCAPSAYVKDDKNYALRSLILGLGTAACAYLMVAASSALFCIVAIALGIGSLFYGFRGWFRQRPLNAVTITLLTLGMLLGAIGPCVLFFWIWMMLFFVA